ERLDALGGRLHLEAEEDALPALRQGERYAQLLGDGEPEVLEGAQRLGEGQRPDGVQLQRRGLGAAGPELDLEPALELLEVAQVVRHLLGRGRLAVKAAARLGPHVALEEAPAL